MIKYKYRIKIITTNGGEKKYYPQFRRSDYLLWVILLFPFYLIGILLLACNRAALKDLLSPWGALYDTESFSLFQLEYCTTKDEAQTRILKDKQDCQKRTTDKLKQKEQNWLSKVKSVEYENINP